MKKVCIVRQKIFSMQRNLRRSAETLLKEGYDVDVICVGGKDEKKQENIKGINIYRVYFSYHRESVFWYLYDYAVFFILASLKLAWLSLKKRYDVVEVQTMPDFLVFVTLFPKLLGSKVILYMFENNTSLLISSFKLKPNQIAVKLLRFIAKISAGYADSVFVSDGPLHKKDVENLGIHGDKVSMILNVPDDSVFNLHSTPIATKGNHFRLVVVSTVLKRYGIQTLIKAIPLLLKEIPELQVDIVGDGEYRSVLEQMARDLGIEGYINFAGTVAYEEVPGYINRADVGIAPMIDDVGAPNKIFEYVALGKATISSDLPGVKAVFNDSCLLSFTPGNEAGLADRILELYHNPEKRSSLNLSAQVVYRKYHWSVMKQEYLKVYDRILKDKQHALKPEK